MPIERPEVTETTAIGAAWLAGLGSGLYRGPDDVVGRWRLERRFEPALSGGPGGGHARRLAGGSGPDPVETCRQLNYTGFVTENVIGDCDGAGSDRSRDFMPAGMAGIRAGPRPGRRMTRDGENREGEQALRLRRSVVAFAGCGGSRPHRLGRVPGGAGVADVVRVLAAVRSLADDRRRLQPGDPFRPEPAAGGSGDDDAPGPVGFAGSRSCSIPSHRNSMAGIAHGAARHCPVRSLRSRSLPLSAGQCAAAGGARHRLRGPPDAAGGCGFRGRAPRLRRLRSRAVLHHLRRLRARQRPPGTRGAQRGPAPGAGTAAGDDHPRRTHRTAQPASPDGGAGPPGCRGAA
ncbi:MAG: hypothetical protein U5R48_19880 [Gammaproteobacteria bacterium]|nr:hypothetical protein [Gammaproteobacteria bacterium]